MLKITELHKTETDVFMVSILGNYKYEFPNPIELTKKMKDYLEDEVEEKYYINNEKADKLIRQLIDNGTLENTMLTDRQTDRRTDGTVVDGTINNPRKRDVANCIKARYDAGISNLSADGTVVVEQRKHWKKNRHGNLFAC